VLETQYSARRPYLLGGLGGSSKYTPASVIMPSAPHNWLLACGCTTLPGSSLTVLVLDDDRGVRETLQPLLRAYGYAPLLAHDVDEALSVLGTSTVDALILDVRLGDGRNGLELLRMVRARAEFNGAPVLILTGGTLSDAEEALVTKLRAYLFYKPEGFDTLLQFLDTLTERDQLH
jgi:DNA-binding response OmpR family regulator